MRKRKRIKKENQLPFCACGCQQRVKKPGNRYILGHNKGRKPFKPGQSGNKQGRPKGSCNRTTMAAKSVLINEAGLIARTAVDMALNGDRDMIKLVLGRLLPKTIHDQAINIPVVDDLASARKAQSIIIKAVADNELDTSVAQVLVSSIARQVQCAQVMDIEHELEKMKAKMEA